MLILTRRSGESVMVGDDVVITIFEVRGDSVRIGIQAPRSVAVHREEVYLELQAANKQAASPGEDIIAALVVSADATQGRAKASGDVPAKPVPKPASGSVPKPTPGPVPKPTPKPGPPANDPASGTRAPGAGDAAGET